jgi:5-methylcytosine-specific restriction protein A
MAKTHGHGNPKWTRDETILALELYQDLKGNIPRGTDIRVSRLSDLIKHLPYHLAALRKNSFRNSDGVAFKLQNLRQLATGRGLGNVSNMDRVIWAELGARPDETKRLANLIRAGMEEADILQATPDDSEDVEFFEGRVITQNHKRRERSPKLRKHLLVARTKKGPLRCDMCRSNSCVMDPAFEDASFEVHHLVPVSSTKERNTKLSDVALLCASCHRILHRAIANEKRWLTIDEVRRIVRMRE